MKFMIWIIVALVIVGGLVWFLSSDTKTTTVEQPNTQAEQQSADVTESSSIASDDEVFQEIDSAVSALE